MGDMGDYWRDVREHRRNQKDKYRGGWDAAVQRLISAGIAYRVMPNPEHYRVAETYDWWPSTGRWRSMDGRKRGHGVETLIKAVLGATAPNVPAGTGGGT